MQKPHPTDSSKFNPYSNFDDDSSEQHNLFKQDHEYHSYAIVDYTLKPIKQDKSDEEKLFHEEKKGDISNEVTQIAFQALRSEQEQLQRKRESYVLLRNQMSEESLGAQQGFDVIYQEHQPSFSSRENSEEYSHALINRSTHQVSSSSVQQSSPSPLPSSQKRPKNDERKNFYGNSFRFIIKEFLSQKYLHFFKKLCKKHGVAKPKKAIQFIESQRKWLPGLSEVRQFFVFDADDPHKTIKLAFHNFYIWYMRKRYMIHILNEKKIEHKKDYISTKNRVIYLPEIRIKAASPLEERI